MNLKKSLRRMRNTSRKWLKKDTWRGRMTSAETGVEFTTKWGTMLKKSKTRYEVNKGQRKVKS